MSGNAPPASAKCPSFHGAGSHAHNVLFPILQVIGKESAVLLLHLSANQRLRHYPWGLNVAHFANLCPNMSCWHLLAEAGSPGHPTFAVTASVPFPLCSNGRPPLLIHKRTAGLLSTLLAHLSARVQHLKLANTGVTYKLYECRHGKALRGPQPIRMSCLSFRPAEPLADTRMACRKSRCSRNPYLEPAYDLMPDRKGHSLTSKAGQKATERAQQQRRLCQVAQ